MVTFDGLEPSQTDLPPGSVGVVIPVRDGLPFFKLALHSVLSFSDHPYRLAVVDHLGGLATKRYLRSVAQNHAVDVLRYDEPFNFAAEANLGLRHVFQDPAVRFGLVLNADAVVEPRWLSRLTATLQLEVGAGIVGPATNVAIPEQERRRSPDLIETTRVSGFCLMMSRGVFERTGGFDEGFTGGGFEDWDLCVRARSAGFRVLVDASVYVHHFWAAFRNREPGSREQMRRNEERFFAKHPQIRFEVERTGGQEVTP